MTKSESNWLVEKSKEAFVRYAGKWVVWCDGEIIGVGDTAAEAERDALSKNKSTDSTRFVFEAIDKSADVIYGRL